MKDSMPDMVSASGFTKSLDALTGEDPRDRACTWTAVAFLTMAAEYL